MDEEPALEEIVEGDSGQSPDVLEDSKVSRFLSTFSLTCSISSVDAASASTTAGASSIATASAESSMASAVASSAISAALTAPTHMNKTAKTKPMVNSLFRFIVFLNSFSIFKIKSIFMNLSIQLINQK